VLSMQRALSRPFLLLMTLPSTAMGFALSVQISVLSWLLSTRYGLHIDEIGLVWAAGPLAGILGQVVVGLLSDNLWFWGGRRRPFIVIGGILSALTVLALPNIGRIAAALGTTGVLGVAITVALALDLAINVSFNPTRSVIADLTPDGPIRTRGYAWMQTVSGSFGVLAYAIGAYLGNDVLVYVAAGLIAGFSIVPALLIEEPRTLSAVNASTPDRTNEPGGFKRIAMALLPLWAMLLYNVIAMVERVLGARSQGRVFELSAILATAILMLFTLLSRDPQAGHRRESPIEFRKILAAHALSWIGVQTMFVYMIAFVQHRFPEFGAERAGQVLSVSFLILNAVGALMPALLLEPLTRRFSQVGVHAASLAVMAAGFAGIYLFGDNPITIYALMGVMGIGWAAIVSLPFAIMSQRVEPTRMGLYMGIFNLSVVLPHLVVSLGIGAFVAEMADKGIVFLIGAATLALSALAWTFVRR